MTGGPAPTAGFVATAGQAPAPGEAEAALTTQAQVYKALRRMLMNGEAVPGERLVVRDLAQRFATSATPVREALRQLVSEDALTDAPNRGVLVPQVTLEAVRDLVRMRCLVEGAAAEWAAAAMSGADLAGLTQINDRMHAQIAAGGTEEYLVLNREFHFRIYRAVGSAVLMPVIERLWLRAGPWLTVMRQDETIRFGFDHHRQIIAALSAGDGPGARRAVALDVADAGELILRHIVRGGGFGHGASGAPAAIAGAAKAAPVPSERGGAAPGGAG